MPLLKAIKRGNPYGQQDEAVGPMRPKSGAPGMGGAPAASAPSTPAQQQAGGQTSVAGSQHVNLIDYLKANEGQGKQMADKVAGGIQQGASKIAGAQDVKMNQTIQKLGPTAADMPIWQEATTAWAGHETKPNAYKANPAKRDPGFLTGQAEVDAAANVSEQASLLGTQGGQQQLLDKAYGSGRTQGESDFDNALMGREAGGKLAELNKRYGGLADWVRGDQAQAAQRKIDTTNEAEDERRIRRGAEDEALRNAKAQWAEADAEKERQRRAKLTDRQRWVEDNQARVAKDPAKRDWADYSKFDLGRVGYQIKRAISPQDWIADAFNVKNPEDGIAAAMFDPTKQHGTSDNYSNMIDFGAVMPPGLNGPEMQQKVYESMTQAEIDFVGKLGRQDQIAWIQSRMDQLGMMGKA